MTKFVKSVGEGSLVPVPDLDEADRCVPFAVCVKKNRRWFWQSPRFEPSPFLLHQLSTTPTEAWESDIEVCTLLIWYLFCVSFAEKKLCENSYDVHVLALRHFTA